MRTKARMSGLGKLGECKTIFSANERKTNDIIHIK